MVQRARETRESGKRAVPRPARASKSAPLMDGAGQVAALEAERDRLQAALNRAEARISELESTRSAVVNRIDWLIDSLNSALEKRA